MLAERRKSSVMRIFRQTIGLTVAALLVAAPVSAGAGTAQFRSAEDALQQGIGAYTGGYYEMAIPALEVAAAKNLFLARYYLARIYADNQSAHTDHAKAYFLYQQLANDYADVDPDDDRRAPFVAKALTALAGYVRRGLPELGLKPNAKRAGEYLHHAAIFFNDEDAQFELAKLQLHGDGVPSDVANGKHWLAILSQSGHAGAQAFLADLYWRGKFMDKDQVRALALISVAVKNAPTSERVWIEDIYQNIYCGASQGVRKQVGGMVAQWDSRYGRPPAADQGADDDRARGGDQQPDQQRQRAGSVERLLRMGQHVGAVVARLSHVRLEQRGPGDHRHHDHRQRHRHGDRHLRDQQSGGQAARTVGCAHRPGPIR